MKEYINKKDIKVAYANDSFELWYLLHFRYIDTSIMRDKILRDVIIELKRNFPYSIFFLCINSEIPIPSIFLKEVCN